MPYEPMRDVDVPGPKRNLVGYGRHGPRVRWPNDARVAVSFVINYEEGSEYTHPAGDGRNDGLQEVVYAMDPKYRDLAVESVFEYGSRAGIWRVERLFSEYRLPLTFYACAVALERNREVAAWLREAGHEPCCHGWRWEEVWRLTRDEERDHIKMAIASLTETAAIGLETSPRSRLRHGPAGDRGDDVAQATDPESARKTVGLVEPL